MSKHISEKRRDFMRERMFEDAYNVKARIWVTNFNDENWDWDMCVLNFRDSLGKNYGLIEHFKEGKDNSTHHVVLEYETDKGEFVKQNFEKFIDAEKSMVQLMQRRLQGIDS